MEAWEGAGAELNSEDEGCGANGKASACLPWTVLSGEWKVSRDPQGSRSKHGPCSQAAPHAGARSVLPAPCFEARRLTRIWGPNGLVAGNVDRTAAGASSSGEADN